MALVNILYASLRIQTGFRMCVYVCEDADLSIKRQQVLTMAMWCPYPMTSTPASRPLSTPASTACHLAVRPAFSTSDSEAV